MTVYASAARAWRDANVPDMDDEDFGYAVAGWSAASWAIVASEAGLPRPLPGEREAAVAALRRPTPPPYFTLSQRPTAQMEVRLVASPDERALPVAVYTYPDGSQTWRRDTEDPERSGWVSRTFMPHAEVYLEYGRSWAEVPA